MAGPNITEVTGFAELNKKLKKLTDNVKRTEVLKVQRRLMRPVVIAYRANLVKDGGTLANSVGVRTVPKSKSDGNPAVAVSPGKRGRHDGFYKFMVVPKGTKLPGRKKGSRKGKNVVVTQARNKTLANIKNGLATSAEKKTGAYVQKQIDRLSK